MLIKACMIFSTTHALVISTFHNSIAIMASREDMISLYILSAIHLKPIFMFDENLYYVNQLPIIVYSYFKSLSRMKCLYAHVKCTELDEWCTISSCTKNKHKDKHLLT